MKLNFLPKVPPSHMVPAVASLILLHPSTKFPNLSPLSHLHCLLKLHPHHLMSLLHSLKTSLCLSFLTNLVLALEAFLPYRHLFLHNALSNRPITCSQTGFSKPRSFLGFTTFLTNKPPLLPLTHPPIAKQPPNPNVLLT